MTETLILSAEDVAALLTMEEAVEAVQEAFGAHGRGETIMPPKVYLPLKSYDGDFRAMPAYLDGAAGVKWVNAHPQNPARHKLPAVMGVLIYSDPATARPLAIMDATHITRFRTGAAGAVAARALARPDSASVGLVGCGVQAGALLSALRLVFPIRRLLLFDLSKEAIERFQKTHGGAIGAIGDVCACDILCTSTPSRMPVVRREFVRDGTHVNAMGADAPGKQELDPRLLADARVFVDDLEQACESGEVNVPLHEGSYRRDQIAGTLGQVVAGRVPGRQNEKQITIFDSTGLAVQDVAVARRVYESAKRQGVGRPVNLVGG
jgi:ornithine cyclodeaminase/alanine dehydrogenase